MLCYVMFCAPRVSALYSQNTFEVANLSCNNCYVHWGDIWWP